MCSLLVNACSSTTALATKDDATQTSEQMISQTLDGIHYTGPRVFVVTTGPCHETDSRHGAVNVGFGFPDMEKPDRSNAMLGEMLAYWRSSSYGSTKTESWKGVTQAVGASKNGQDIGAAFINGFISVSTGSCYSTPGPQTPVTATVTATS